MRSYDSLPATTTTDASVHADDAENMVPLHALGNTEALGDTEGNTIDDECLDV